MNADPLKLRIAALSGFLAVALGAFGAHMLKPQLEAAQMIETWKTASNYHLIHSVVLLVLAFAFSERGKGRFAFNAMLLGVLLFSGSLYAMSLTGVKVLGAITPFGGVSLMLGWLMLAFQKK